MAELLPSELASSLPPLVDTTFGSKDLTVTPEVAGSSPRRSGFTYASTGPAGSIVEVRGDLFPCVATAFDQPETTADLSASRPALCYRLEST